MAKERVWLWLMRRLINYRVHSSKGEGAVPAKNVSVWSWQERAWYGEESEEFQFWTLRSWKISRGGNPKGEDHFHQMKGLGPDR